MTSEDVHRFGERVRGWRYDNRWTQQRLAEALGYDVSYVAKIEQGRRRPSRQFVARLNEVLAPSGQDLPKIWRQPSDRVRLPVPGTPLIGRDDHVARVVASLRGPTRCVTLVGAPGVGKSSLAVEAAWRLAEDVRHGACFVPLAEVADPASVPAAVAGRLGILQRNDKDPGGLVIDVLRPQAGLLVLDNFEHVLAARTFVEALLRETPHLKILVTSRESLGLPEEQIQLVPALEFPELAGRMPERPEDYPAVDVFVTRARAVKPGFELSPSNARDIAEICARLDGLPLAIGLAASASVLLSPSDIAASLRVRMELPSIGVQEGPARTLTAALAWSWDLLLPAQRTLLSRLAVFSGGCTLRAVEAVCGEGQEDLLAALAALARKNLVEVRAGDDGHSVFHLLETVRRFCFERLAEAGEVEALRRRHCDYYVALSETAAAHVTGGPDQGDWLRLLDARYPNLASAFGWAVANDRGAAVRLGAALWRYFSIRRISDGRKWLGLALDGVTEPSIDRLRAQVGSAVLARLQADVDGAARALDDALALAGQLVPGAGAAAERALAVLNQGILDEQRGAFDRAEERFREAEAASRQLGDERGVGHALNCRGVIALHREDHETASALFLDALARFRALGDGWSVAFIATNLGWIAETDDLLTEAGSWYGESRQLWEALGDEHGLARAKADLGRVARRRGDTEEAAELLEDALQVFQRVGDRRLAAACLLELAAVAARRKRRELAARLVGAAEGVRASLHAPAWPGERRLEEGVLEDLGRAMDPGALQRARRAAQTLSVEDAIELAECGTWPPPARRRPRTSVAAPQPALLEASAARSR